MFKILIISVGKLSGGVEKYTLILGQVLASKGIEVHYALREGSWLDNQILNANKITVNLGKYSISDMIKLRDYVRERGINIVHCNSNNGLFISQLIQERSDCKKLAVIHGDVCVDQNHKGFLVSSIYKLLETWLIKQKCSCCVAVSKSIKRILIERGIHEKKIRTVYTGIDPIKYNRMPDFFANELCICTVGNLLPVKNHLLLLESLYLLRSKYPQVKCRCDIYGEGPERKKIEEYIRTKGLNNVSLKGFDENVRYKMNSYQIYIHTSKYESFGISIVEAMNAGCCIIANAVGGVNEILDDDCGFIIKDEDPDVIADCIATCYEDRELLTKISMAGKERFEKVFMSDSMAENLMKIYKELITV